MPVEALREVIGLEAALEVIDRALPLSRLLPVMGDVAHRAHEAVAQPLSRTDVPRFIGIARQEGTGIQREDAISDYNDGSPVSACPYPAGSMRRAVYEATWFEQRGYVKRGERDRAPLQPVKVESEPYDEFRHFTPEAKAGVLHIRALADQDLLDGARDQTSAAFQSIAEFMGPKTNLSWISARCATEAYDRGIMEPEEMDRIVDE